MNPLRIRPSRLPNQNWNVLEDDREVATLSQGLSLADTIIYDMRKAAVPVVEKRRTLDDMRRLSEHIRATKLRTAQ